IDIRRSTGEKLRLCLLERTQGKIKERDQKAYTCCDQEICDRLLKQGKVECPQCKARTYDRTHEWGHQHSAADHCSGVDVQADGRNNNGTGQYPGIGPTEGNVADNTLQYGFLFVFTIMKVKETEDFAHILTNIFF